MTTRFKIISGLLAVLIAVIAVPSALLWRGANPSYKTAHFSDRTLEFDHPSAWDSRSLMVPGDAHNRIPSWSFSTQELPNDAPAPFNTRWDRSFALFMIRDWPASEIGDPKKFMIADYKRENGDYSNKEPSPSPLVPVKIAGLSGWKVSYPGREEVLDIGPFKTSLYKKFFSCEPIMTEILLPLPNGRILDIGYQVPSDKIAAKRYERVFNKVIDSLVIKPS